MLPSFVAGGDAPMTEAINKAADLLDEQRALYKAAGTSWLQPRIFFVSAGRSSSAVHAAAARLKAMEDVRRAIIIKLAVTGADLAMLDSLSQRPSLKLANTPISSCFSTGTGFGYGISRARQNGSIELPLFPAELTLRTQPYRRLSFDCADNFPLRLFDT